MTTCDCSPPLLVSSSCLRDLKEQRPWDNDLPTLLLRSLHVLPQHMLSKKSFGFMVLMEKDTQASAWLLPQT